MPNAETFQAAPFVPWEREHRWTVKIVVTWASPSAFMPSLDEMILAKSSTRKAQLIVALAKATLPLAGENSNAGRSVPSADKGGREGEAS